MGTAAFDRAGRSLAAQVGGGLRRLRRRREARLAARAGLRFFPDRRLGRARRLRRHRATAIRCRASTSPGAPGRAWSTPFVRRVRGGGRRGLVSFKFRHRVNELTMTGGAVDGVRGDDPRAERRGARRRPARATTIGRVRAERAGGDRHLRRHRRQPRSRAQELAGAPGQAARAHDLRRARPRRRPDARRSPRRRAARIINRDRMWHYTEGIQNWNPIWTAHGIRILPGPSSLWLDARGKRLPVPLYPGLRHARHARAHHGRRATTTRGSC